jgi:lipopolysaccharide export system protein LptC
MEHELLAPEIGPSFKNTSNTLKGDNHEVLNRKADNATIKRKKKDKQWRQNTTLKNKESTRTAQKTRADLRCKQFVLHNGKKFR